MKAKKCKKCGGNRNKAGGCNICEMFASGAVPGGLQPVGWPMKSVALGMHADQVAEANARNKRHGVNVTYAPDGDAIIPDAKAYKRLQKLEKVHNKRDFY
jgi:hypothetical protein